MVRYTVALALILSGIYSFAQNDLDAIRYSRVGGAGGTSRSLAMGGAFGAIGADLSCGAYNPAGLGLFRKGEISFSGALKFQSNQATLYNNTNTTTDATTAFNNFGISIAWKAAKDPDSRHVLAFTNTQLQNFNGSVRMSGYTNSNSIAKDMLNLANEKQNPDNLSAGYENLGFNTYLIDTADNKFYSLLDTKRTVRQTRDVVTSGRINDLNFSYAHAYKDQFYIGVSLGVPQINYQSTTTHTEEDNRDSMRVGFTSPTSYTSTYVDGLPVAYTDKLGFNNLTYTEYFKTSGSGINLKIGGIARVNDIVRLGAYYHTPTFYKLTDEYYNSISVAFDQNPSAPITDKSPANGGVFNYKLVTPSRLALNAAFLINKMAVIGIDYEFVNYKSAQLKSDNVSDFAGVNDIIKNKYKLGQNLKVGAELNVKPIMLRAGYIMQGSPFGDVFTGDFVRHTVSLGVGFRTKNNFYFDLAWYRTMSNESYYLFTTLDAVSKIKYTSTMISATAGIKF